MRDPIEPSVEVTMIDDDEDDVFGRSNHVENVGPRPILPKPNSFSTSIPLDFEQQRDSYRMNSLATNEWDTVTSSELDANGRPWNS